MPEDNRVLSAVRNLGVLFLDPSLGFCETLPGVPLLQRQSSSAADGRTESDEELEFWLQSYWTPLFCGDWLAKPVRGFFRRVSLQIDETEFEERTVTPEGQAWMIRALSACCRHWLHESGAYWPGLHAAWREIAARMARFTADHLRYEGRVAARRFEFFEDTSSDWEVPLPVDQGLWLSALSDLYAVAQGTDGALLEEVRLWVGTQLSGITSDFDRYLHPRTGTSVQAQLLKGLLCIQTFPGLYREDLDAYIWALHAQIIASQGEDGSWDGILSATAEAAGALAHAGICKFSAGCPDTLGRAIVWLHTMQEVGRSLPAPMAGLRIWEYRLNDIAALLESGRLLGQTPLLHPDDRKMILRMQKKWWQFAVGRRTTIPKSQRYGGLWVAGLRYVREHKQWRRDLRIEPGAIGRLAYEAMQSCTPSAQEWLPDEPPRQAFRRIIG